MQTLNENPVVIIFSLLVWAVCLFTGISFIRQAFVEKAQPGKSIIRNAIQELLFRLRFALGLVLLILVAAGMGWALIYW